MASLEELIGGRLKTLRHAKNLTAGALATRLGITQLQLAAIETGKQRLTPAQLVPACALLGSSVQDFMRGI